MDTVLEEVRFVLDINPLSFLKLSLHSSLWSFRDSIAVPFCAVLNFFPSPAVRPTPESSLRRQASSDRHNRSQRILPYILLASIILQHNFTHLRSSVIFFRHLFQSPKQYPVFDIVLGAFQISKKDMFALGVYSPIFVLQLLANNMAAV